LREQALSIKHGDNGVAEPNIDRLVEGRGQGIIILQTIFFDTYFDIYFDKIYL
jgi:hypothetical protein